MTNRRATAGITLVEMLLVVAIVGLMVAIAYPTVTSGLDGFRLRGAVDQARAFFLDAQQFADRNQQVVQLTVDPKRPALEVLSEDGLWTEVLPFSDGVVVANLEEPRSVILFPGSPVPAFALLLKSNDGERLGIRVNPLTGLPEDWDGSE